MRDDHAVGALAAGLSALLGCHQAPRPSPVFWLDSPRVTPARSLLLLRIAVLVALAVSAALLVDYTSHSPAFCSAASGCGKVRASGFGYLFGRLPLPLVGVVAFATQLVVSLLPEARQKFLVPLSVAGALGGIAFLGIQGAVIGDFCVLCVAVDTSSIAAGALALVHSMARKRAAPGAPDAPEALKTWSWIALGALAVLAPTLWPRVRPEPPVPAGILAYYAPNKINVVEFADFECPFCRLLHPELKATLQPYGDRVHFVRLNMPLERHEHAKDAARAWVCAEPQGKGDAMAEALFAAEDLTPSANRKQAEHLGLDVKRFDACTVDAKTDQRIDRESQVLKDAGFQGLPTTWIGGRMIVGAQANDVFQEALARAERREDDRGVPGKLYFALVVAVAIGIVLGGRGFVH